MILRNKRKHGLSEFFRISSEIPQYDEMTIEFPDKNGIVEIEYDSAEYPGSFSLKQIKEMRDVLNMILSESGN